MNVATCLRGLLLAVSLNLLATADEPRAVPRVAAIVTAYYHNSHADMIVSRLLQGHGLDGKGPFPQLKLVSLYTDQVPKNDKSRALVQQYRVPIHDTVAGALTLGTGKLAVDAVLLICEHGDYPDSPSGSIVYPKRRLFEQIARVFESSGRSVPVFNDKHLADTWVDAKWIYDTAQRLKAPMMAGSSLPVLWRYPATDVRRDAVLKEIVAVSYHRLDTYGFHALEMVQCLAEQRRGGETGVVAVQCLEGDAVWQAGRAGRYDSKLLDECFERLRERRLPPGKPIQEQVKTPSLFRIEYRDGLVVSVLTLNYAVSEWTVAWRYGDGRTDSTLFWTQEARPFEHFGFQTEGIERMFHTGQPTWPVERTLLTTGQLDALLQSRLRQGERLLTPQLNITYAPTWRWQPPPPPTAGRPLQGP